MNPLSRHKLMQWFSPSFPIGAYTHSHGLEQSIISGEVKSAESLQNWIGDIIRFGSGWNDAILLAHVTRAGYDRETADLALALSSGKERFVETIAQGNAFVKVARETGDLPQTMADKESEAEPVAFPIAVGLAAHANGISPQEIVPLYLHAFAANLVSVGVRLVPIGQTAGQQILGALFPLIDEIAEKACAASLDDLSNSCFLADLSAMEHETLQTRLFRT